MILNRFLILIIAFTFLNCKSDKKRNVWTEGVRDFETQFGDKKKKPLDRDPERNNPNSLNLFEQQLFIDTTGDSRFFAEVKDWREEKTDRNRISKKLEELNADFDLQEIDLNDFPTDWIIVHQYKGQKMLINLRPGQKGDRYRFTNNSVTFYHQGNTQKVHGILSLENLKADRIELTLISPNETAKNRKANFSISPTKTPFLYYLKCESDSYQIKSFVTPLDEIHHFEMMVWNNQGLVWNPVDFDHVDFNQIEEDLP